MFLYFWTSGSKVLEFQQKFFDRFVKAAFYVSRGNFWLDCFFYEFFWVSSVFSACGKVIQQHWRNKLRKFVKCAFYLNNKTFQKKFVFFAETICFHNFFRLLVKNLLTSVGKPSARFQKLLSTLVHGNFLPIIFFLQKNLRLLTDFEWKCLEFGQIFLTWWSKLFSLCPEEIFEEIFFFFTKRSIF